MNKLSTIIKYKNPRVINKIRENTGLPEKEAADVFTEMLKWLWLNAKIAENGHSRLVMPDSMEIIDEAWHTFILFTMEYETFCKNSLGRFIHHNPGTTVYDTALLLKTSQEDLFILVSAVEKYLGDKTVVKWFYTYPSKYKHIVNNILTQKI